jgi:hypothetical protein
MEADCCISQPCFEDRNYIINIFLACSLDHRPVKPEYSRKAERAGLALAALAARIHDAARRNGNEHHGTTSSNRALTAPHLIAHPGHGPVLHRYGFRLDLLCAGKIPRTSVAP